MSKTKNKKKKHNNYKEFESMSLLEENLNLYKKIDELNKRNKYLENRIKKTIDIWNAYKHHEKINGVWLERESDELKDKMIKMPNRNPYRLPLDEAIDPILEIEDDEGKDEDELSYNRQQLLF